LTMLPTISLNKSYRISRIIKGGWQLSGDHGEVKADRAVQDMVRFVEAGVTAFDCADIYNGVEELIGRFRVELYRQHGADALRDIRIHTKFVPDRDHLAHMTFSDVQAIVDRSLRRLGQEQLDLVQFHWWDYRVPNYIETLHHLERLREKGKIALIGVTNFDGTRLEELNREVDIASAQVQFSLLDRRASGDFADIAKKNKITLLCYGVLAGGFLTDDWLGRSDPGYHFTNRSLVKYRLIIDEFGGWSLFQELLFCLRKIADNHEFDIASIALSATLESSDVGAVIVGARYADRMNQTLKAFDLKLSDADHGSLDAILSQRKGPNGPVYELERDITGPHGRIMKYNLNKRDESQFQATPLVENSQ